ncbi:MAG: efflux RND transporter periplasmic adaptor subunit [Deltaproteobacteria bacterium]|nr:efflux RND transporter periplasmic adaptor subunit [Deltaproteobacteria bacterium]
MKKKIIVVLVGLLALAFSYRFWNKDNQPQRGVEGEAPAASPMEGATRAPAKDITTKQQISHYTCPMHPHIHEDRPGNCPICSMRLVPVYKEISSINPLLSTGEGGPPEAGRVRGITISPERQQRVGIKTEIAARKNAVKEIRTFGRVAFDPDLAVAEREFIEISKNVPNLKAAAVSRLRLLGMSAEEIRDLEKRGTVSKSLYLPEKGDPVWIYATLYENEMALVQPGMEAAIDAGSDKKLKGIVRAVDPVVDPTTRSVRARVEVPGAGGEIKPESFVTVVLKIDLGEALLIPKSSVIDTGTRKVLFVVHDNLHFEAREVETGAETGEEQVILKGLSEGEKVVTSATFLVDSESQLKASVEGMGGHEH